ncbi:MAG: tetratricopeptide repeat protein [Firmicutes bacterium]|nr:tetratricopeptide repeat protein [Bacillota bacterium]
MDKVISFSTGSRIYYRLGTHFYYKNNMDKALSYYQRALAVDPENPINHFNVACLLSELGKYRESSRIFKKILADMDSDFNESLFWLAMNHGQMHQYREAHRFLKEYLDREPDGEYSQQAEEIIDYLRLETPQLTDAQRDKIDHLCHQGIELVSQGDISGAVDCFFKASKIEPELAVPRNNLALAWFYLGDLQKAISETIAALAIEPDNIYANCNLAIFCHAANDELAVRRQLRVLNNLYSDDPDDLLKLGTTYGLLGKDQRAYNIFSAMIDQGVKSFELSLLLAVSAHNSGRSKLAVELLDQLQSQFPDNPYARAYRNRVLRGRKPLPYHLRIPNRLLSKALEAEELTPAVVAALKRNRSLWPHLLWIAKSGNLSTQARITEVFLKLNEPPLLTKLAAFIYQPDVQFLCRKGIFCALAEQEIPLWRKELRPDKLDGSRNRVLELALEAAVAENYSFNHWYQIYLVWQRFCRLHQPVIRNPELWKVALLNFVRGEHTDVAGLARKHELNSTSLRHVLKRLAECMADI